MKRFFLKSKLHNASVTAVRPDYEGSLTVDVALLEQAGILPFERIDVYNITRGTRLTTYAIEGERGSGELCINGAAAHLAKTGDRVIVACYALLDEEEFAAFRPKILILNEKNRILSKK